MSAMSEKFASQLQPVVAKWDGFLAKVEQRLQEVHAEAEAGMDQLIAMHTTDYGPIGAGFTALQTRYHGLGTKVSDAWEKIEEQLEEINDQKESRKSEELDAYYELEDQQRAKYDALYEKVDLQYQYLAVKKSADWARQLYPLAQAEIQTEKACTQCGAPFQQTVYHQAVNLTCPHCGSVNSCNPGMATAMYFGSGVHNLAEEQCWAEKMAELKADKALSDWRHPTQFDFQTRLDAAQAFWDKYFAVTQQLNPGFDQPLAEAAADKMKHFTAWDQGVDREKRIYLSQAVEAAANKDPDTMRQVAASRPHHVDWTDVGECIGEHLGRRQCKWFLKIWHEVKGEKRDKKKWVNEELSDIMDTVRR